MEKKEIGCKDCLCEKEGCEHHLVYYCDCCKGVHCEDCGAKWFSPTKWCDHWYNTDDLDGPTHTWETDSGGNLECYLT